MLLPKLLNDLLNNQASPLRNAEFGDLCTMRDLRLEVRRTARSQSACRSRR